MNELPEPEPKSEIGIEDFARLDLRRQVERGRQHGRHLVSGRGQPAAQLGGAIGRGDERARRAVRSE